jgi:hypothetical protein
VAERQGGLRALLAPSKGTEEAELLLLPGRRWELLSLNSEAAHAEDSAQVRWLRRAPAKPRACRIAFWHPRPLQRWEARRPGRRGAAVGCPARYAAIVVAAHDHEMQRLNPTDDITQFVVGAGGRSHYKIDRGDPRLAFANDRDDGAEPPRAAAGVAAYAFVSASGKRLDSGTISCR